MTVTPAHFGASTSRQPDGPDAARAPRDTRNLGFSLQRGNVATLAGMIAQRMSDCDATQRCAATKPPVAKRHLAAAQKHSRRPLECDIRSDYARFRPDPSARVDRARTHSRREATLTACARGATHLAHREPGFGPPEDQ